MVESPARRPAASPPERAEAVRTVAHLTPGDLADFLPLLGRDQVLEDPRADEVGALADQQRADVGSIRAIWAIQDRIALDADEEKALELNREIVAGQERVAWNPGRSIPCKGYEFNEGEAARIKSAVQTWDCYAVKSDRSGLEPLLKILFEASCSS